MLPLLTLDLGATSAVTPAVSSSWKEMVAVCLFIIFVCYFSLFAWVCDRRPRGFVFFGRPAIGGNIRGGTCIKECGWQQQQQQLGGDVAVAQLVLTKGQKV